MSHLSFACFRKANGFLIAIILVGGLLLGPARAGAVVITVNSTADNDISADGACTLREAIDNANDDADTTGGDCVDGDGADTITLPVGTYTLALAGANEDNNATGDLDISSDITINGAGAVSTIIQAGTTDSNGIDRVFEVPSSGNLTLNGVTVRHGKTGTRGGGIYAWYGRLTINNSAISNNTAAVDGGGINKRGGWLFIVNSAISGNSTTDISGRGGGIYIASGTATIENSTISGNSTTGDTATGGGVWNWGTLTIKNSVISGNSVAGGNADGGGVYNNDSTLTIENSTLSGNSAQRFGGGLLNSKGTVDLIHSTITENNCLPEDEAFYCGGGIENYEGTISIKNSIVKGNTRQGGLTASDCYTWDSGNLSDLGYNVVGRYTGCPGEDTAPAGGAKLDPLADNHGDTQTHALQFDSPALNNIPAGQNGCGSGMHRDQRGVLRPMGGSYCDTGAYETGGVFWDGGGADNNWTTALNWTDDTVPATTDAVVFNNNSSKDAVLTANTSVAGIVISGAYNGALSQSSYNLSLGDSFSQSGGTFSGGSGVLDISDSFVLDSGTFNAPANLNLDWDWQVSGGTFVHNNGAVTFSGSSTQDLAGITPFYDLTVGSSSYLQMLADSELGLAGDLLVNGTLDARTNSDTLLRASGLSAAIVSSGLELRHLIIDSNALLTAPSGDLSIDGNWTGNGAFHANNGRVIFDNAGTQTMDGVTIFHNLTVNSGADLQVANNAALGYSGAIVTDGTLDLLTNAPTTLLAAGAGLLTPSAQTVHHLVINDGLVGYWKLDQDSGTVVPDSSGYGHDAELRNDTAWTADAPATAYYNPAALSFDGSGDYLETVHHDALNPGNALTMSAWVKLVNPANDQKIVGKSNSTPNGGYVLGVKENSFFPEIWDSSGGYYAHLADAVSIVADTWTHLAVSWQTGGSMIGYVDGIEVFDIPVGSNPIGSSTAPLRMGVAPWNTSQYNLNGRTDDVRIYNRVLSAAEITSLADGNHPQAVTSATELAAPLVVNGDLILNSGGLDVSAADYGINLAGNFTRNGGVFSPQNGSVTFNGSTSQALDTDKMTFHDLEINNGSTLHIYSNATPDVLGAVSNNGILRHSRIVDGSGGVTPFIEIDDGAGAIKYRGAELDTTANLGEVTVSVREVDRTTTFCDDTDGSSPPYANRCYEITTDNSAAAAVTLWALTSEVDPAITTPRVFRNIGTNTWERLHDNPGHGSSGDYTFAQGDTPGFSDFIIAQNDNNAPTAVDDSGTGFSTDEDSSFTTGNVLTNDSDPDSADILSVSGFDDSGTTGLVTDNGNGTFEYDPNGQFDYLAQGENAEDSFSYTVSDGQGGSDTATVTIVVNGVNDPPTATDDGGTGFSIDEDSSFTTANVLSNDSDPDNGASLSVSGFNASGTTGTVTNNIDGTFGYDPNGQFDYLAEGESATDSFSYTVSDDKGATDTATVTITVTGVNDLPIGQDDDGAGFITNEDSSFTTANVLNNDSDPDTSDTLSVGSFDTSGTTGVVTSNGNGTFVYSPNSQFEYLASGETASDFFIYTVSDGSGGGLSPTAAVGDTTVTITVNGVNDAPTAADDSGVDFTTDHDKPFTTGSVLNNDSDPDNGDTLSVSGFDVSSIQGLVTNNSNGTFEYDPDGQFDYLAKGESGEDSFTYTVSDIDGANDTATVTITVNGPKKGSPWLLFMPAILSGAKTTAP